MGNNSSSSSSSNARPHSDSVYSTGSAPSTPIRLAARSHQPNGPTPLAASLNSYSLDAPLMSGVPETEIYAPLNGSDAGLSHVDEVEEPWNSLQEDDQPFDYSAGAENEIEYSKADGEHPWETPGRGGVATFLPGPQGHIMQSQRSLQEAAESAVPIEAGGSSESSGATATSPINRRAKLSKLPTYRPPPVVKQHKLTEWYATAICGNDITSSCLYVTGLCIAQAGVYAPVALILVALTLYLFRNIYGESVTALPLNGGAYNVLLNTTSKSTAAVAACLTILSYVATCVVSAAEAIEYAQYLWSGLNQTLGTIILICAFAFLNLMGMSESAVVALSIFAFHILSLTVLVISVFIYTCKEGAPFFISNFSSDFQPSIPSSLIFGFSTAMLGVSGFESSANFVEEQAEGVFVKTLRNMWGFVAFFNPAISILAVCVMDIKNVAEHHQNDLLAQMALKAGPNWYLDKFISADAFLVLSGSVLTSYVGVTGLCRRLALDRCMPQFLLHQNAWRKTNHVIILGFCAVCCSMYLLLDGDVQSLASVYSVSFLSVMSLFAIGNILLKYKRSFLPRQVIASWGSVVLALFLVLFALAGVLANDTSVLLVWAIYFSCTGLAITVMFFRMQSLKILYHAMKHICKRLGIRDPKFLKTISNTIKGISSQAVVFFVKHGALPVLNKAVLYVRQNEDCSYIRIVHIYEEESQIPSKLQRNIHILDEEYPKVKIDLVLVKGQFSPQLIDYCSQTLKVPKNLMFITCPKADFTHKLESLGGVRLITH